MPRRLTTLLLLLVLAPALSGCIWSRELSQVRRDIERQLPEARFRKQLVLNLGPVSLGLARLMSGLVPDDEVQEAASLLRNVSRVKVGVYEIESLPALSGLDLPRKLRSMMERDWQMAVKSREDESVVYLLYRERRDAVREMFVVVLDREEMVLVRFNGNLNRLMAHAIERYGDEVFEE